MKIESSALDKQALYRLLKEQYVLEIARLTFVPQGEESYSYMLETPAQARYFVKISEQPSDDLNGRYEAAHRLHSQCGLAFVVYPHATRDGARCATLGDNTVAVFDFVEGTAISDHDILKDEDWKEIAHITATLHQSVQCQALPSLPQEHFEIWFEEWLQRVLTAAADTTPLEHECAREARTRLAHETHDILATLALLKRLAARIGAIPFVHSLTHGDLNPENMIKDPEGRFHILDWGKLSIGPPERDLINFVGERFEMVVTAYVSSYEKPPRLYAELFEFYSYYLTLWGVADYGSWILLEDADLADKEHAWMALQRLFPIDHTRLQGSRITEIIQRVNSTY